MSTNIDNQIDQLLKIFNHYVYENGFDEIVLPDLGVNEAPVFIGVTLTNLSTVVRKGKSRLWGVSGEGMKVKLHLGLADMKLHVYQVPFANGNPMTWHMTGTTVELGLTLHTKEPPSSGLPSKCTSTWDYIQITNLGDILVRTADPEYNNKPPPDQIKKLALDFYNENLNGDKPYSIKQLNGKIDLFN